MCSGLGVAQSDQPARHGYSGVLLVSTFIAFGEVSKKVFCALEDVKSLVSKLGSGSGERCALMARSFALACDQVFYF